MILVFGGTTEGRKAVEVLEEGGAPYFYSTKTGEQDITLQHGVRIDGALDEAAMMHFCTEHGIRMIVDAAHPFAALLHQTIAKTASALSLPVVRFERIYPPCDPAITWIDDYTQIPRDIHSFLATTGVQSISKLKPLEADGISIFYRILNRPSSIALALKQGATQAQLCYYDDPNDIPVQADAILLKESGLSGGFTEKIEAAKACGMRVIAIKRPEQPKSFIVVDGPYGLRRMVEKLLPEFYPLHSGLTTGTCATAAAVAACIRLTSGEMPAEVPVMLPNGETIHVAVSYGDDYAACIKEAGDDPDVTNGIEVRAQVTESDHFEILGGEGVGRFTLPGFDYPPGEAAINKAQTLKRTGLLAAGALAVALTIVGLFFYMLPSPDVMEYVKPIEEPVPDEMIEEDMDALLGIGADTDSATIAQIVKQQQHVKDSIGVSEGKMREYNAKAEEIFRKQFTKAAESIISKVYNKDQMNSSEKDFTLNAQKMTNELVFKKDELMKSTAISSERAEAIADKIIEQLTEKKKAEMDKDYYGIKKQKK